MQIIVVGAGIAGLAAALSLSLAGHKITLVESASQLAEVGAGVQLTPNATKWFWRWGLGPDILAGAVLPDSFKVRDPVTGNVVGRVDFADFLERYGGPYLVIHRADIHKILHEHAVKAGTDVHLNSRVAEYDFENASLKLKDGTVMHADLVVAVDGINSTARTQFTDSTCGDNGLRRTGFAAFRMMADVSKVAANSVTESFVASQSCNCVIGDGVSIMTYMVKGDKKLNLVLGHSDDVDTSDWSQDRFRAEIRQLFKGYGGASKALLETALSDTSQTITNWPTSEVKHLDIWSSNSGKFVMMGDAAHAMSFYLSMGVSMAVEDAAALTECLSLYFAADGKVSLAQAVDVFGRVRSVRAGIVRDASSHAGHILHSLNGSDRSTRDEALRTQGKSLGDSEEYDDQHRHFSTTRMSYGIVDRQIRDCFYGYDLSNDIQAEWMKLVH